MRFETRATPLAKLYELRDCLEDWYSVPVRLTWYGARATFTVAPDVEPEDELRGFAAGFLASRAAKWHVDFPDSLFAPDPGPTGPSEYLTVDMPLDVSALSKHFAQWSDVKLTWAYKSDHYAKLFYPRHLSEQAVDALYGFTYGYRTHANITENRREHDEAIRCGKAV